MIRKLLLHVLPFAVPFIVYAIYMLAARRAERRGIEWRHAPWFWLTLTGLVLTIVSFVGVALLDPGGGTGAYVPAHVVDGKVVPGSAGN